MRKLINILDFLKDSFNALAFARQEAVQCRAVLDFLIGTAWGPEQIAGLIKDLRLPVQANEALVAKDIAENKGIDERFGCLTLIGIGRHQVITDGNAKEGADGDQFEAKVAQVAAGAVPVIGATQEIALVLAAFVAQYGHRFSVE
jgi:hypothetical protein